MSAERSTPTPTTTSVGVVVGNPKPRSRTFDVAVTTSRAAASAAGLEHYDEVHLDLADLGADLFNWSSPRVRAAVSSVSTCALLIVASPTYKAAYTGLLKSFLDWFGPAGLAGVVTVPVMVGAGAGHALAVEVHLRPVLVEIGAMVPTRGLYVREEDLGQLDAVLGEWLATAGPALVRLLG